MQNKVTLPYDPNKLNEKGKSHPINILDYHLKARVIKSLLVARSKSPHDVNGYAAKLLGCDTRKLRDYILRFQIIA
jgi:hypothetical protein